MGHWNGLTWNATYGGTCHTHPPTTQTAWAPTSAGQVVAHGCRGGRGSPRGVEARAQSTRGYQEFHMSWAHPCAPYGRGSTLALPGRRTGPRQTPRCVWTAHCRHQAAAWLQSPPMPPPSDVKWTDRATTVPRPCPATPGRVWIHAASRMPHACPRSPVRRCRRKGSP